MEGNQVICEKPFSEIGEISNLGSRLGGMQRIMLKIRKKLKVRTKFNNYSIIST